MATDRTDAANLGQIRYADINRLFDRLNRAAFDVPPAQVPITPAMDAVNRITMEHINTPEFRHVLAGYTFGTTLPPANIQNIEPPIREFTLSDLEHCYQECTMGYAEPSLMILPQSARQNFHNLLSDFYMPERIGMEQIVERRFNNCVVHFHNEVEPGHVWFIHTDRDGMPFTLNPERISLSRKFDLLTHIRLELITDADINIITGGDITWPVR